MMCLQSFSNFGHCRCTLQLEFHTRLMPAHGFRAWPCWYSFAVCDLQYHILGVSSWCRGVIFEVVQFVLLVELPRSFIYPAFHPTCQTSGPMLMDSAGLEYVYRSVRDKPALLHGSFVILAFQAHRHSTVLAKWR